MPQVSPHAILCGYGTIAYNRHEIDTNIILNRDSMHCPYCGSAVDLIETLTDNQRFVFPWKPDSAAARNAENGDTLVKRKLVVGDVVKILEMDVSKILYQDWMGERNPQRGDIATVSSVFGDSPLGYELRCEPKPGFLIWGVQIYETAIQFEIVKI